MDKELIFWIVALASVLIIPAIWHSYKEHKETERMRERYRFTEYHDDMEDWR